MKTSMFDYHLPEGMIAQEPLEKRDASRLLVLHADTGRVEHRRFFDLPWYLDSGDLLVMNETRVLQARLLGRRPTGGFVEALVLEVFEDGTCRALLRHGRKVKVGEVLSFEDDAVRLKLLGREAECFLLENATGRPLMELLEKYGRTPLPPYVEREARENDRETYQTVYAREAGSVAAPTAGLHFTRGLVDALEKKGVELCRLTLHVGYGTFKPVKVDQVERHRMHTERYSVSSKALEQLRRAREEGRRIVAVGTTSARLLETLAARGSLPEEGVSGETDIFIYPGFKFKLTDALVTNFHLPRSTLLMLVSALAGREKILAAYEEAVREGYRFYSYGDAMLIT